MKKAKPRHTSKRKTLAKRKKSSLERWNFDLSAMPDDGAIEVLRVYPEVYRHMPQQEWVINPQTGTCFIPRAWRERR